MTDDIKKKAEEWVDKYVGPYTDRSAVTHELVQAYLAGAKERDKFWAIRYMQRKNSYIFENPDHIREELEQVSREALKKS